MQILQIVPHLPPTISGVGDYALLLAKQLRDAYDINTHFIVCDVNWNSESRKQKEESGEVKSESEKRKAEFELDGFKVFQLKERSAEELLRVLLQPRMPTTVLLHYVGYGYQKRGCPLWLVRALRAWKMEDRSWKLGLQNPVSNLPSPISRHFVTMFHELYAFGPPWGSAFWTFLVQRWIAKTLARLSKHVITNMNIRFSVLKKSTSKNESDFTVLPVFSNMGEPKYLPAWNERSPRMIVFGSAGWRRKVYLEYRADLEEACRTMGLDEIVDIGAAVEIPQLSVRISKRGILSAVEASHEMLAARAGFFAYPGNCLGKSTIFSAYAAHGLVPVTFEKNGIENKDDLSFGKHFVSANALQGHDVSHLENIGKSANEWYGGHSLTRQAAAFAEKLAVPGQKNLSTSFEYQKV